MCSRLGILRIHSICDLSVGFGAMIPPMHHQIQNHYQGAFPARHSWTPTQISQDFFSEKVYKTQENEDKT